MRQLLKPETNVLKLARRLKLSTRPRNNRVTESQFTEWCELEGTFKGNLVQNPCHEQGHLSLDKVAQSPIQPEPQHFQWWGSITSLGNCASVSLLSSYIFLPYGQHKHTLFQFKAITPCPVTKRTLSLSFLHNPFKGSRIKSAQSLLFFRLDNLNPLSLSLKAPSFQGCPFQMMPVQGTNLLLDSFWANSTPAVKPYLCSRPFLGLSSEFSYLTLSNICPFQGLAYPVQCIFQFGEISIGLFTLKLQNKNLKPSDNMLGHRANNFSPVL